MKYYFELLDNNYNNLGALIPDGNSKKQAIKIAEKYCRENGIKAAQLSVNSMKTDNILDMIDIESE